MRPSVADRFNAKTEKTAACWLWRGATDKYGYGVLWYRGRTEFAHRISWLIHRGGALPTRLLRHTCDVTGCVNPAHLIEGTHRDNVNDRLVRGRSARGEENGRAKLTKVDVFFIRKAAKTRSHSNADLSRMFTVDRSLIRQIVSRRIWKSV